MVRYSLVTLSPETLVSPEAAALRIEETPKENTMDNMEMHQRAYMSGRMYWVEDAHSSTIRTQFGYQNDEYPTTPKAMIEMIKAGKYILPERDWDCFGDDDFVSFIEWRDPSIQKDKEGFDKAHAALAVEKQRVKDAIELLPLADAVKEFEGFKTWKYTN